MKTTVSTWAKFCLFSATFLICGIAMAKSDDLEEKDFTPEFVAQCREKAKAGNAEAQTLYGRALLNGWGFELHQEFIEPFRKNAVEWFREAAAQEYFEAQYLLGECYEYGTGVQKDNAKAIEWYLKAAGKGHAKAQYRLGRCYESGLGVGRNDTTAVAWYRKAAEQGYGVAQYQLAECYEYGIGIQKDDVKAIAWYRKAAEQGIYEGTSDPPKGKKTFTPVKEEEYTPQFIAKCRKKAETGDAEAQTLYGIAWLNGWGFERNETAAVEWFQKAAEQGYAAAQFHLGRCYDTGSGIKADKAKAEELIQKSAEQGYSDAQFWLGELLVNRGFDHLLGLEVEKNKRKSAELNRQAVEWFQKAAEQGNPDAQFRLGRCYEAGAGVKKDENKAVEWYRKAANQGHGEAQYNLAKCYELGIGVTKDIGKAVDLYRIVTQSTHLFEGRHFASQDVLRLTLVIDYPCAASILKDFRNTDNALKQLSQPPRPGKDDFLIGYYMEKDSRTWEWGVEESYNGKWQTCDRSGKVIRISGDEGYVHLYVGALCERDRDFVEKTISCYRNNSRYVWTNGVFVTKRNLDGIDKALELIQSKSPSGRQHVTVFQVTGNHTALACKGRRNPKDTFDNRPLIHLQGSNIGNLYAEGDEIDFDKLYWASTYTYETRGGSSRTVLQLATDIQWAVLQVRDSLGLFDETDPLLGKPTKGSPKNEPENTKNGPEENQDEETIYFGSGFFVSENGYFLTNDHVIRDAKKIEIQVGDRTYPAHRVDSDSDIDIALLKVDTKGRFFPRLAFSPRRKANLGEDVYAIGYPRPTVQGTSIKVTKGVISGLRGIMDDPRCYQIDAAIQPGNSGGPLVDAGGAVVGMAVAGLKNTESMMSSGDIAQNVNYAIKNSFILAFLDSTPECEYGIGNTTAEPKGNTSGISEEVTKACGLVISYP